VRAAYRCSGALRVAPPVSEPCFAGAARAAWSASLQWDEAAGRRMPVVACLQYRLLPALAIVTGATDLAQCVASERVAASYRSERACGSGSLRCRTGFPGWRDGGAWISVERKQSIVCASGSVGSFPHRYARGSRAERRETMPAPYPCPGALSSRLRRATDPGDGGSSAGMLLQVGAARVARR